MRAKTLKITVPRKTSTKTLPTVLTAYRKTHEQFRMISFRDGIWFLSGEKTERLLKKKIQRRVLFAVCCCNRHLSGLLSMGDHPIDLSSSIKCW